MLANLGVSHCNQFERLGELGDLEKAIEHQSRALALAPNSHSRLPAILANLGVSHINRFDRLGELDDLDKAIKYKSSAIAMTPDGHPHLQTMLANLGVSHSNRFYRLGEIGDLEKAIEYKSRAVALTPDDHPDLSSLLTNLGVSHKNRFQCLGELNDLEKAIEYQSRALALTPDSHPHLSIMLSYLSKSHNSRFERLGELGDLEKAIECNVCALELIDDDHPAICQRHFVLALSYVYYYEHTNSISHLQDSLHSFRISCRSAVGAPRTRFRYARQWTIHASRHSALNSIEAYQTTIDLLPQFIWLGATISQRYQDLLTVQTLAVDAAAAAIVSAEYALALEWLENARCVVWNQHLMLRSPLDQLQSSHPALATRLKIVTEQLHNAGSESREAMLSSDLMAEEMVAQEHRRLAKEHDKLLTQARTLPNFEDFLRPIKVARLIGSTGHGPIIVINCDKDRCDALIILPGESDVSNLSLPDFSANKARDARSMIESSLKRQGLRERGVRVRQELGVTEGFKSALGMIWNDLVKPTLDFWATRCVQVTR
ncbi:aromatic di-alanine and TPR containing protein, putative, partial [Rhizoctonia solani AG-3 Rhs1AP]